MKRGMLNQGENLLTDWLLDFLEKPSTFKKSGEAHFSVQRPSTSHKFNPLLYRLVKRKNSTNLFLDTLIHVRTTIKKRRARGVWEGRNYIYFNILRCFLNISWKQKESSDVLEPLSKSHRSVENVLVQSASFPQRTLLWKTTTIECC